MRHRNSIKTSWFRVFEDPAGPGKDTPAFLMEPTPKKRGETVKCIQCLDRGYVRVEIDEERLDEMWPCSHCRRKCSGCGSWFAKTSPHFASCEAKPGEPISEDRSA